jgi:Cu2+-exporting ATPase
MVANAAPASSAHAASLAPCAHCGLPVVTAGASFCCSGCEAVYGLLHEERLTRYYELQGDAGQPVPEVRDERADRKWLEPIAARLAGEGGVQRLRLDIQGLHCSACVWLVEELFARQPGGLRLDLNPALGTVDLVFDARFALADFVVAVERFGYQLGPALKRAEARTSSLLWRLGVCAALAMNAMIFAVAFYAGLDSGPTFRLFQAVVFALSTLSVLVGGSLFMRSAWQALGQRVLHMDLPIALGIGLAYASSTLAYLAGRERGVYLDTLAVFITLMLLGRFLQERVLERNRRQLLDSDGAEGLYTRRLGGGAVALVRCTEVRAGDLLLIAPGDLVCVDARVEGASASFSLDWVNGESAPRAFTAGELVPAGAFNVGARPERVVATTDFVASALTELLRAPAEREAQAARSTPWWRRLARVYVLTVLAVAGATLAAWLVFGHDAARALDVTAAVLIVTCPCAFGIATPLAYELAQAGLRRAGLLVRSPSFLDRAAEVRRVVFDKTGTLTTGALRLVGEAPLDALTTDERDAMYTLAASSTHPKSLAIAASLARRGARFIPGLEVEERTGRGTLARDASGHELRLGAPMWAAATSYPPGADVLFAVDGTPRAALVTGEEPRPDAATETRQLAALGYEIHVLSGDAPDKTVALARRLGIPASHAQGGLSPQDKAAWLALHDHEDTLMIGDGINDAIAVERAFASGTPAIDRPFMPARSDFYFVTAGLRPVRLALATGRALVRLHRKNLGIAVAYNVVTVGLAAAGLMSPLLCAVVMPISSLTVVLSSTHAFSRRSRLWRS